jgi:hypothetical protein
MLGYSHPRNIRGPNRGDRHLFPIEGMYVFKNYEMLCFRKLVRKSTHPPAPYNKFYLR